MEIEILYEDKNIAVVNKPKGLIVHATVDKKRENLFDLLKNRYQTYLGLIHRLDKDTSGAMIFSLNEKINSILDQGMKEHSFEKKYWAIVKGKLEIDEKVEIFLKKIQNKKKQDIMIKVEKGGVKAITFLKTLKSNSDYSLIECTLHTGRMHQIRATLLSLGHPILGDNLYGEIKGDRLFLHSRFLKISLDGTDIEVTAPIDETFQKVIDQL